MNWLQKISEMIDRDMSVTLIDGQIHFSSSYHDIFLANYFQIPRYVASLVRYIFPRGRVITDYQKVIFEGSPELKNYQHYISENLNIPFNAIWNFNESHYFVGLSDSQINSLKDYLEGSLLYDDTYPSHSLLNFLNKYLPDIYKWFLDKLDISVLAGG